MPTFDLAGAPAGNDPSKLVRVKGRGASRAASWALLATIACSRVHPDAAQRPATADVGNTGVRGAMPARPDPAPSPNASATAPREPPVAAKAERRDAPAADEKALAAPAQTPASVAALGSEEVASEAGVVARAASGRGAGLGAAAPIKRRATIAASNVAGAPAGALSMLQAGPPPVATTDAEFDTEAYKGIRENPFRLVTESPLSTFSVDVDTASYSNMRRFVEEGRLPPADAIRVEEWVNYFSYDDALPAGDEPIGLSTEVTECPWDRTHELLRVALTTEPITQDRVPARNLVFLIDVSGSMEPANKLPLLKRGLAMLARQLRPIDSLSIVVYAGASGLALPPTSGADQEKILGVLGSLESGGSTNGAEGINLAYALAEKQMKPGGINRVILATDGDFNVGVTSEGELERLIEQKRKSGVFLTVLGFGEGNLKDSTMETLADKGNGNYAYVDSLAEARKVLVREAGATLVTVAKDVKLQLEFNPARAKSYRLVGYENRVLADQDFNDDTKDAGELGAGHHVTAFYEIVPAGARTPGAAPPIDPLKYQSERGPAPASASEELATIKIRYKAPDGARSLLFSRTVRDQAAPLDRASESLRFGVAVAEYALALRGSPGVSKETLPGARALAAGAFGPDPHGERHEFVALMDRAGKLSR